MTLNPPKKTAAGYYLAAVEPIESPEVTWDTSGKWNITPAWDAWAAGFRSRLLDALLANTSWFSRPPRREVLDPLFSPWSGRNMQGAIQFFCKVPDAPPGSSGSATWNFDGLLMNATEIRPIFSIATTKEDKQEDQISLFGDGVTEDGSSDGEGMTREIQLEEIEDAPPASAAPTRLRGREWEARKFLGKERVREARLKAQIAERIARKEEARFYHQFGDLEDGESHFSDYDLTDNSGSEEDEEDSPM